MKIARRRGEPAKEPGMIGEPPCDQMHYVAFPLDLALDAEQA